MSHVVSGFSRTIRQCGVRLQADHADVVPAFRRTMPRCAVIIP